MEIVDLPSKQEIIGYTPEAVQTLQQYGIGFARRGSTQPNLWAKDTGDSPQGGDVLRGITYDPTLVSLPALSCSERSKTKRVAPQHAPLLVPTTISGGENITFADFLWATEQAVEGQACVLTFHGVPVSRHDIAAIWVAFFSRHQRYRC